ncbi:PLP-dependent aminotransferase family protein [Lysinibacillus odysseyi]|uniref:GntR family transcriptional regulator n=1 Tax=Lysinibacillus odysseyi 34hs-1 = NBRC 100172 TaxID=1220589 RepID=A0A0A3IXP8_9BACI|nr:PLP-dependent aminotransferase family protein [Lysinibacillus odysseyi]KGR88205.1 GntR family transcriptional regulator [Lysinibacillus odysseyi 34hs-1 = NBRC 100172]
MEQLFFTLNKDDEKPLYEQLYLNIKQAIIRRDIVTGTKLPSKRQLGDFLNISQTTVELAYGQLLAEGYIISKPRVGYFVEAIDELPYVEKEMASAEPLIDEPASYRFDFSPGQIDEDGFPFRMWRKYAKDMYDESSKHLLQPGHPQGEYALRVEIARYLYESRGIQCIPEQIVIGSGTEQLLPMILRLFDKTAKIALENPGYSAIPHAHIQSRALPIPVDEDGLIVEELEKSAASLVYITPSHQFPTGAVLSATRRTQLLKWAAKGQRYIIEDDYDSEFRYIGKPIPALQGLDKRDNVIYMSTFSKSIMPSLRVAYFVLPLTLLPKYREIFNYYSATVPRFDQYILANFMRDGHFSKHLNRMRKIYRKKHDKLISVLSKHYPAVKVSGDSAGMHVLLSIPSMKTNRELLSSAQQANLHIQPITRYILTPITYEHPTFILGFGGIPIEEIEEAIHALMAAFHHTNSTL